MPSRSALSLFFYAPRPILVLFAMTASSSAPDPEGAGSQRSIWSNGPPAANQFKGKSGSVTGNPGAAKVLRAERLIVVGAGKLPELKDKDFLKLGGTVAGKLRAGTRTGYGRRRIAKGLMGSDQAAAIAAGIRLRAYKFDRYKTKKKDGEEAALRAKVSIAVDDVATAPGLRAERPRGGGRDHRARPRQ